MSYKQNNDKLILNFIRENSGCRRRHIQDKIGLSKAAIAKIVNRLIERHFIVEAEPMVEKRLKGKPYKILHINSQKAYFLGVSVRLWNINICLMDLGLNMIWEKEVILEKFEKNDFQNQYNQLIEEAKNHVQKNGPIKQVGLALPATVSNKGKIIDFALYEKELEAIDFHSALEMFFKNIPIVTTHHSVALSYFETIKNKKTSKHIFILNLDYGIGGAFIVKGKSYIGAHSYAGNIGAFFPYSSPRPTLIDLAFRLNMDIASLTSQKIDELYKSKTPLLMEWIKSHGEALSMPLSAVIELFDPKKIILGGLLPKSVLKALQKEINLNFLEAPERITKQKAKIKIASEVGSQVYAYGAARLALKKYIKYEFV